MIKVEAQRQLKMGYVFAIIGFIIGVISYETLRENIFLSGLIIAYAFWGTYWGFRIVTKPIHKFFAGTFLVETSIPKLIWKHILFKLTIFGITFFLAYFIGLLGGGIYKQVTLMNLK